MENANPQRSFFDGLGLAHRVAPGSFYGRMGILEAQLFCDDDLKEMYCDDDGRPSLPPSLLSGVLLLQFYDDVSDAEAVERLLFDLRWKVALNISLDYSGFHPSSLSVFRARLVEHKQERYAFDQLLKLSRQVCLDKVATLLGHSNLNTTRIYTTPGVQDLEDAIGELDNY